VVESQQNTTASTNAVGNRKSDLPHEVAESQQKGTASTNAVGKRKRKVNPKYVSEDDEDASKKKKACLVLKVPQAAAGGDSDEDDDEDFGESADESSDDEIGQVEMERVGIFRGDASRSAMGAWIPSVLVSNVCVGHTGKTRVTKTIWKARVAGNINMF
jgi:hypothetical protein